MDAICPDCGHAERSDNRRGARLGNCPHCGTPMRAHTGLRYTVQLTEPKQPSPEPGRHHRQDASGGEPQPAGMPTASNYQAEDGEDQGSAEESDTVSSALDDKTLARMRTAAAAEAGPFADPALLREADALLPAADRGWLERVIGHPVPSYRSLTHAELLLAVRAAKADAAHLRALADSRRAEAEHARQHQAETAAAAARAGQEAWRALRSRLPVPVTVQHNWTARHLDGYEQGGNHIVVREDLNVGRFRRTAGVALCWTPSRARELRHVSGNAGDENRLPDCKSCLRHAENVAAARGQPSSGTSQNDKESATSPPSQTANTRWISTCARCYTRVPGPGGILCPPCRQAIEAQNRAPRTRTPSTADDETDDEPGGDGWTLREAAHRYLDRGLPPVPAWAARQNGECCCPRGAACPRPGKHPRSVHAGPGRHDYSWKPLASHSHQDINERFADGGEYAGANLMLAIPAGMMVIDIDHDDGGHQAVAMLVAELGELPATLGHQTPHGQHLIYTTPPGWTGRAWVGKDAHNPLPPGIDLRMPGQILMAPPSRVPGAGGQLTYGPATGDTVAGLPPAYLDAWTPPQLAARPLRPAPIAPSAADRAASYVHKTVTGVLADLAGHEPGGRNTAIYTAALKVGSVLGAARSTPGAEHAADGWTDEAAQDALMEAATRNGYVDAHGATMARSAIRSGLRNGLRNPRALPDFTSRPLAPGPGARTGSLRREPGTTTPAASQPVSADRKPDIGPAPGPPGSARPSRASRRDTSAGQRVAAALWAAGYTASSPGHQADGRDGYQMRALADGSLLVQPAGTTADIDGVKAASRARRILDRYASVLHDAGFKIARPGAGNLVVRPQPADTGTGHHPPPGDPGQRNRMQANRSAVAANEAYRARDFDQARQHTSQAAALDPSRTALWQQHRSQIDARELFLQAQAPHAEGDQDQAQKLMEDARQLDPRMQTLWDQNLPRADSQRDHSARGAAAGGTDPDPSHVAARRHADRPVSAPQWPGKPALYRNAGTGGEPGKHVPATRQASAPAGAGEPSAEAGKIAEPGQEDGAPAARWHPRPVRHSPTTSPKGAHIPARPPKREREKQDTRAGADHQTAMDPAQAAHKHVELRHQPEPDPAGHPGRPGQTAHQAGTTDWRDAVIDTERRHWQPRAAQPSLQR